MPVIWRFLMAARDQRTGEEHTLFDELSPDPVSNPGRPLAVEYAIFLLNEVVVRLNGCVAQPDQDPPPAALPYVGMCRACGRIVDDQHLLGGERDLCDTCWAQGAG